MAGASATVLLVDREAFSGEDPRLVAHLDADEPPRNVSIMCADYLHRLERGPLSCRRLRATDLRSDPAEEPAAAPAEDPEAHGHSMVADVLAARVSLGGPAADGTAMPHFQLHPRVTPREPGQLRWWRCDDRGPLHPVSLRDAIAVLESYEPIRSLTSAATGNGRPPCCEDQLVSVSVLRAELKRVLESPIVLNRALREAVLERVERGDLSMSEIAIRCGRVKRDAHGNVSGETSWLGRRLGLLPEGGKCSPTPWIHSDVLALIARRGLGVPPREVEL